MEFKRIKEYAVNYKNNVNRGAEVFEAPSWFGNNTYLVHLFEEDVHDKRSQYVMQRFAVAKSEEKARTIAKRWIKVGVLETVYAVCEALDQGGDWFIDKLTISEYQADFEATAANEKYGHRNHYVEEFNLRY